MNRTYIKLIGMAVFWSGAFISGKILTKHITPFEIAFLRFVVACFPLIYLLKTTEPSRPIQWIDIGRGAVLGFTGVFLYNYLFFSSLQFIQANRGSLMLANTPILVGIFGSLLLKEPISKWRVLGLLFSVAGAIVVISKGDPAALFTGGIGTGEIFILLAVLVWVIYSLAGKVIMKHLTPLRATTYSSILGSLFLLPFAWRDFAAATPEFNWIDGAHILYLGVCASVMGFLWYYEGVQKLGAGRASQFINLVPVFGVLMAGLFLGEPISPSLLGGGALVFTGVYLSNFKS